MNEIEKMYEKAGFQKKRKCEWDKDKESCFHSGFVTCDKCTAKIERTYPPFTAWKQFDLFKLLMRHPKTELYCRYANDKYKLIMYTKDCCTSDMGSFENILASIVCNMWGLLSEEEKQQIKEILENE